MAAQAVAGGLSGGLGSVIAGGDFWRGAQQGAIVTVYNHAVHGIAKNFSQTKGPGDEEQQQEQNKPSWDLNGDGKLSLREANKWYREAKGKEITVEASSVDLDFVNPNNWKVGETNVVQTLFQSSSGRVYGQLTLTYEGKNQFSIKSDTYNFENHSGKDLKVRIRNFATKIGRMVAGQGTRFKINFSGLNTVRYREPSTQRPQGWF